MFYECNATSVETITEGPILAANGAVEVPQSNNVQLYPSNTPASDDSVVLARVNLGIELAPSHTK